jgi:hypothetical protein
MLRFDQAAWIGIFALSSGAAFGAPAATSSPADAGAVNAVWVDHDLAFTYMGFTTHYSCGGMEDKVKYVLKQLGARPGYKVTSSGCVNLSGPEIMPRARVRAALPMEATPELLAQLARDRSTRELAAKVGGKPAASADAATAQFPAVWRTVTFEGTPISDVQDGDCELMEQLLKQVLKPMGVREVAGSSLSCVPHQVPINAVNLKLQVLSPPEQPAKAVTKAKP